MAQPSRTAEIRAAARDDPARATALLTAFVAELFGIPVSDLQINHDQYSLNSLNGFFRSGAEDFFFKFHQEEGEEAMTGEYYRAGILHEAGLPVDRPVHLSALPGEQILVYRRRSDPRFSDVLLELDRSGDAAGIARAAAAEAALNRQLLEVARATLRPITPEEAAAEPIHRLFHDRLVDRPGGRYPGGRFARFYHGRRFAFPGGVVLHWDEIADAPVEVNGQRRGTTLRGAFDAAHRRLRPAATAGAGGIVAHGDAHNANVWYERGAEADRLAFFDPAFAGRRVPALLAEVKSTFHNIFAHPFWLYDPAEATARFGAGVRMRDGVLCFDTDWRLSPVREALLRTKAETFWAPWLRHLKAEGLLPADWEATVRAALFLCPMLVMNLTAAPGAGPGGSRHTPTSSAIGLSVALCTAAPPRSGGDMVSDFFDSIRP